jgi:hypothetical protein
MAHRKNLVTPHKGMSFVWNVDNKVGSQITESNDSDDVSLVQLLFNLIVDTTSSVTPGCKRRPPVNGQMEPITAFWIYFFQVEAGQGTKIDGYFSPIRGQNLGPFMLSRINFTGFVRAKAQWENLPNHPMCPPSLKTKLLGPPKNI